MAAIRNLIPNPLATRFGRLAAFFLLYMTEGIPLGFTATAIATQMRRQGISPTQIGAFVGALYLPWAWKWLVGPVVDVVYSERWGRRRGWILLTQVLMSIGLIGLLPIDFARHMTLFTMLVLLINLFSATQDVAIDALACNVLSEQERGLANGLMFAGAYVGQAVGGAGVLLLMGYVGFNATFFLVAGCVTAVTVCVVLPMVEPRDVLPAREPAGAAMENSVILNDAPGQSTITSQIKEYGMEAIRAFFNTRAAVAGLFFALLPAGAYALSMALVSNLAVELGFSDTRVGQLALVSTITSAVGCVVGGYLSDRFGRRRMLAIYIAGTAIPTVWLGWVMQRQGWIMPRDPQAVNLVVPPALIAAFWAANVVFSVFQGLMYGTRTALFMDVCTRKVAATQFTAYMAMLNFVMWYSSTWQGWSSERWGYPATLALDGAFGLACLAVLPWMAAKAPVVAAAGDPAARQVQPVS
jgi:PAT family beta-lactamase induction signal transducer AmpG